MVERRVGRDPAGGLDAAELGHPMSTSNHVGPLGGVELDRLVPVGGEGATADPTATLRPRTRQHPVRRWSSTATWCRMWSCEDSSSPVRGRFDHKMQSGLVGEIGERIDHDGLDRSVKAVAAVSLAAGLACALAPASTARLGGIDAAPAVVRAIGVADLVLAAGLYLGRPSWPWLMARAATNPVIAAVSVASGRSPRARLLAAGLLVATASDLRTAARLRTAHT
jgi:hypothetical protein